MINFVVKVDAPDISPSLAKPGNQREIMIIIPE